MAMRNCTFTLTSLTPYSQSSFVRSKRDQKEDWEAYEARTVGEKTHTTKDGFVFIDPMALKFCITAAAKRVGRRIPGRNTSSYGKRFDGGILLMEPIVLPIKNKDMRLDWVNCHANGQRGSGKRVRRCFQVIDEWTAQVTVWLTDDIITREVFEEAVREAGQFIGIGRFRPENGGWYGRFQASNFVWQEETAGLAA